MLQTFKNGQGSVILRVKLLDSSSTVGAGLTGLTSSSAGLIISTIADVEASATTYTQAGSTIEAVTTLGTYAAPTATKCRFKEVDSVNHKGIYEIQIADARFAVANAKSLLVSILGATNLQQADFIVQLQSDDPFVAKPTNFASLSVDSNGRVDVIKVNGTSQTAGDVVGIGNGIKTQTDKMAFTVANQIDANVLDWKSATAPAMTGDAYARLGAPAGASVSADVAAIKSDTAAVKTQTDKMAFTVANQVDCNVVDWKGSAAPAMTGDAYARLGTPAGLSVSADIAAVLSKTPDSAHYTAARGDKLDDLDATISSRLAASSYTSPLSAAATANAVWDEAIAGHLTAGTTGAKLNSAGSAGDPWATALPGAYGAGTAGNILGTNLDTTVSSRTKPADTQAAVTTVTNLTNAPTAGDFTATMKTSLNAATPASVVGAVGSVTGNVGGNVVGSVASVTADVGITQAGADKVWGSATRTLTSFGTLVADVATAVWAATTRLLTAGTNIVLAKGTGLTGLNDLDAAGVRSAVGLAFANLDTQFAAIDSDIVGGTNAVLARTDVATSTRLAASSYVAPDNTDILAIKAKTDNLPAAPAAVSDIPTAAANADKLLGRSIAGGADGGRTVQDSLRASRNRIRINGSTLEVYEEDDTTIAWSGPVTTAPGDPITEVNPL